MPQANQPFTIYIVRHGATKLNAEASISVDRERGWSDVPLTEEGRQEARDAAAKLRPKGITAIVSSDLNRAKETAQIIGGILGMKPEFSFKLRPWNLGYLTGKDMKDANPEIAEHARNPDEPVKEGESFNKFCTRAFDGLAEAAAKHHEHTLLIVAHHRVERLVAAWEALGKPPDHSIDIDTFLEKGDPPGGIIVLNTTEAALIGKGAGNGSASKLFHMDAHYRPASGKDKCGNCRAYNGPNDCDKVKPPIYPGGWCAVGVSKIDGHRFDPKGEKIEKEYGMAGKLPSINAGMDELRGQMARGGQHGASPGSAGNIGGRMGMASPAMGGGTAGLGANPSRMGNPPVSSGNYQQIAGSPGPSAPPTAQSVRTHSLALGGMKHMVAAGHLQPAHAKAMEAKSRAHIAAYSAAKQPAPRVTRFGSLGGATGGIQSTGPGGSGIPSASPMKMDY